LLTLPLALLFAGSAGAEPPSGEKLARKLEARPRAQQMSRVATLTLLREDGDSRQRRLLSFWKEKPDAKWLVFFALTPPELKQSAFLARDYFDSARDDDQFFYKPARKRAQRVPSPGRGESFLGSDFSFEDIKKEDRVEVAEYTWKNLGQQTLDGSEGWLLEQVPRTPELAKHLGYGRIVSWVDPNTWVRRRIQYFDTELEPLKTVAVRDVARVGNVWTARRIEATNHQTGHRSALSFSEIDTESPVDDEIFTTRTLEAERVERLARRGR